MKDSPAVVRLYRAEINPPSNSCSCAAVGRAAIASLLCCALAAIGGCKGEQIGPSEGEVAGVIIGVGAVIAVGTVAAIEIHKSHHNIKGCVSSVSGALELQPEGSMKTYLLDGDTAGIKVGDLVRLHGSKEKRTKGSALQNFSVEKIGKDYGACPATPVKSANP